MWNLNLQILVKTVLLCEVNLHWHRYKAKMSN